MEDREQLDGNIVEADYTTAGRVKFTITDGDVAGVDGQVYTSRGPNLRPGFEDPPAAATSVGDFQRFNSSNTWNKPSGYSATSRVFIRGWGGGGAGASGTGGEGGGGGAGYTEKWMMLSDLGSSETVTIGAGGTAVFGSSTGGTGGNSTFGSHFTAYGGAGGVVNTGGGGGGGPLGAASGTTPGSPLIANSATPTFHGGTGQAGIWHGGGGATLGANNGANSIWGGGGGGGHNDSTAGAGGTSVNGGNGGAAAVNGATGVTGTQPGGGGGACENTGVHGSGAGGAGRIEVFVFAGA